MFRRPLMELTWQRIAVLAFVIGAMLIGLGYLLHTSTTAKEHSAAAHVENVAYENSLAGCERGNEQRKREFKIATGLSEANRPNLYIVGREVVREMLAQPHALPTGEVVCSKVIQKP